MWINQPLELFSYDIIPEINESISSICNKLTRMLLIIIIIMWCYSYKTTLIIIVLFIFLAFC